jgi:hypothetical protein
VVNPLDRESSFYWWTNIAVPEAEGVRVLAPARYALYIDPTDYAGHRFGWAALPRLPSLSGADGTYSLNSKFSNEFFFQCEESTMPWETALDGAGRGFFECSTHPLSYRKIFCWGSHRGGRHWQEFLAEPGVVYLEIQGGVAPSQLHGASLGAGSSTSWTQAFGALDVGGEAAGIVHGEDWAAAVGACDAAICKLADPQRLAAIHRRFESTDDAEVAEILALGSGWGALEKARYAAASRDSLPRNAVPAGLAFPDSTIGSEQRPWLELLETGRLPRAPAEVAPGAFVTSPEWRRLLEKSLDMPGGAHWRSLYHVGVMRLEALDESGAEIAWNASIAERSSAWAMRNLAILAARRGDKTKALDLFGKAWGIELIASRSSKRPLCGALAAENLAALIESGKMQDAIDFVGTLPAIIANCDRIRLLRAKGLLALGKLDEAEAALDHDFAVIREGQNDLTDLWFEIKARRLSEERLVEVDEPIRAEAKRLVPPERLDFRMEGPTDTGLVSSERPSPLPFG